MFYIAFAIILFIYLDSTYSNKSTISLYVLVDNNNRICYTGSYQDCKNQLTTELRLIKLEGILK
jgi:hypothetical protein